MNNRVPPRGTDPRRERLASRLRERIGGSAEDFYRDASRLVDGSLEADAGSRLLGHCAREIESAVREVLVAMFIPPRDEKAIRARTQQSKDTHRALVEEIVRRLGLPVDALEVDLWLQLADRRASSKSQGLASIAHRQALRHAPPIDDEMRVMWRMFEGLLVVLLRELEARFAENLPRIRALAQRPDPGDQSVTDLNALPNTLVLRTAFYEAATPGWLGKLDDGGFFDEIAKPLVDPETGQTYLQPSPAIGYLARTLGVPEHAARVLTIVERIDVPHEFAERDLLRAAVNLDGEHRRRYARHLVRFIGAQASIFLIAIDAADFAAQLADSGDVAEASAVLEALLSLKPDPAAANAPDDGWFRGRPVARVDEHAFERVITKGVDALMKADPLVSFRLLLPQLGRALELSERPGLVAKKADLSEMWMPNLSHAPERYGRVQAALLARSLRASALAAVERDAARLTEIVDALEASGWTLTRRIALDILTARADEATVRARILDGARLDRDRFLKEHDALVVRGLELSDDDGRRAFCDLLDRQQRPTEFADGEAMDPEHAERVHESWKRDLVTKAQRLLPSDVVGRYAEVLRAPQVPPPPAPVQQDVPPLDAKSLADFPTEELIEHLKTWTPANSVFEGPTLDAQAGPFREAIVSDPARFTAIAFGLKELDPTYVRTFFDAIRELIEKDRANEVAWGPVLELALSAVAHEVAPDEGMGFGRDPGWGWTRKAIADVLRVGLSARPRHIPYVERERIRALIEVLVMDALAPALNEEEHRDALMASINTTSGSALHAAIEYVFWVADEVGGEQQRRAMPLVPEVAALLERHVAVAHDPSLAARGAFGFHLGRLLWYDEAWTIDHLKDLFPEASPAGREMVWQAYVVWHTVPAQRALEIMADEYRAAIGRMSSAPVEDPSHVDVDEALAEQFAHALIRGWITMDSADGLLPAFYEKATPRVRGHVLESLGRIIDASPGDRLQPEHCEQVQALYERRLAAAAAFERPERRLELEHFGWIYVTGRCDTVWMVRELIATLELTGSIEPDSKVMDRIATLAEASPVEAVRAVDLLTETPKERWFVQMALEEIQTILRAGLRAPWSRDAARRVVNRLYADGHGVGIVELLEEPEANA